MAMLVLSRRVGEEIVIGEDVRVRIVAVNGGRVRVAVCAPKSVLVDRLEVSQRRVLCAMQEDRGVYPAPATNQTTA
jgi:carbon storage regulator